MYHTGLNIRRDYGIGAYKGAGDILHTREKQRQITLKVKWKLGLYKGV